MLTRQRLTYNDLLAIPNDENLHELVRGEIVRMPPPKGKHGRIKARLVEGIGRYLHQRALSQGWTEAQGFDQRDLLVGCVVGGEFGIRFALPDDPDQVRGLDVGYLSPEQVARHEAFGSEEYFPEAPILVAEVISPSESANYINEKVTDFLAGGAEVVWLLYPRTQVIQIYRPNRTMHTLTSAEQIDGGDLLPGLSIAVASLFR